LSITCTLIDNEETQQLAHKLNIPDSVAANLFGFWADQFITEEDFVNLEVKAELLKTNKFTDEDIEQIIEINKRGLQSFIISVQVIDNDNHEGILEGLMDHFKNLPYISRRIEASNRRLTAEQMKLEINLTQLDSLKGVLFDFISSTSDRSREGSNNVVLSDQAGSDPINVFREDITLYRRKLSIEEAIFLQKDFELIRGFESFVTPASVGLVSRIIRGILYALAVIYTIIFLIEINKYLNKIENQKLSSASQKSEE